MRVDQSENIDALLEKGFGFATIFLVFHSLSVRNTVLELSLEDERACVCEAHLSFPVLETVPVLALILQVVVVDVTALPVLLSP